MSLSSRIASALAECDALALAVERASVDLRKAHTAAQTACATALVEFARIKRELREIDADLTPVRGVVETRANRSPRTSGAQPLHTRDPKVVR